MNGNVRSLSFPDTTGFADDVVALEITSGDSLSNLTSVQDIQYSLALQNIHAVNGSLWFIGDAKNRNYVLVLWLRDELCDDANVVQ